MFKKIEIFVAQYRMILLHYFLVLITTRMMKMPLMIKINGKKLLELLELASYA